MDYSVIVPVYNRAGEIGRCVEAIIAGIFPRERYEVIVVDNGSTDGSDTVATEAGAKVLRLEAPNRCRARNLGAEQARGRWLVFTDSDCAPASDWLAKLDAQIQSLPENSDVVAVAGAIRSAPATTHVEAYIDFRLILDQEKFLTPGRRFSPPFAATANLAIDRERFLASGGFDPGMPPGEDAELCWRLTESGGQIDFVPAAVVVHHHRATLRGLWRQSFGYGVSHARQFAKWRTRWGARVWIEPHRYVWCLKGILKAPWCCLTGKTPLERRMGFYDAVANAGLICGRLRGSIQQRVFVI